MMAAGERSFLVDVPESGGRGSESVSASEISELVSGALQDAICAAEQPCPDTYLDILESRKRERMATRLSDLPSVQMSHPVVQAELLADAAMFRAQNELAKEIVEGIRRFSRLKRRAVLAAMS